MAVNKVIYGGKTLVDLTSDTVTPATLAEGVTAHNASGNKITGTMKANTPTQFTNLYDPANVVLKTYKYWDSSTDAFKSESQSNVNNIEIPYDHAASTPVVLRLRGIGTVRDRFGCYLLDENLEYVGHYQLNSKSYFSQSYDEHGDAVITFKGNTITRAWKYFGLNFQYIGINSNATALTGPIITINEPIGNGGYAG